MSTAFYKSVIEDEIKAFNIKEESLKIAAKSVSKTYSRNSLNRGQTFLDYNIPSNRCAYIFKYAHIHTVIVTKYFSQLLLKKEVQSSLKKKETLKICCLGGGPGTDIVGLFKALAAIPSYHKKVVEVTVLDICGGWRNSFKRIITNLMSGKMENVPESFINASDFKFKLIEVDLLQNLPANIVTVLSEADIVCMVKFVSAILGFSACISALQVIGDKLKSGAVVLFIDNFSGNVFKPLIDISHQIQFKVILGPLHHNFNSKSGIKMKKVTSNEKKMFACLPLTGTAVTALGFIKSDKMSKNVLNNFVGASDPLLDDDDDNWDTDDEDYEILLKEMLKSPLKRISKAHQHQFTQTDKKYSDDSSIPGRTCKETASTSALYSLVDRLYSLLTVVSKLKQQMTTRNHCCHCH